MSKGHVSTGKKSFQLDVCNGDDRDPFDVYNHEVEVLYSLVSLWGTNVPRLFFTSPWSCSIGLELGECMPDEFEVWTKEGLQKTDESIKPRFHIPCLDQV